MMKADISCEDSKDGPWPIVKIYGCGFDACWDVT